MGSGEGVAAAPPGRSVLVSDAMKAVVQRRYGAPEVLAVGQVDTPVAGSGEALVRVRASTVSTAQMALRKGRPLFARLLTGMRRPKEAVPGSELAGEVVATGTGVASVQAGDRIVAATGAGFGAHAEYARVPAEALATIPADVSDEEAVAIGEGGLVALPFLRDTAGLRPGQRVLINGAAGSVGSAAVQLAKHLGADVTAVCSARSSELVSSLAADRVIDYAVTDFTRSGERYDVIFDAAGKSSFGRSRAVLEDGGIYMTTVIGLRIVPQMFWTSRFGRKRAAITFTGLRKPPDKGRDLRYLMELAAAGQIRAVIDRRYPLEDSVEAHRYVESGHKQGAVVLTV
jgi:NADPH:quinone reductase-like Zn-dependent oxidoreductase